MSTQPRVIVVDVSSDETSKKERAEDAFTHAVLHNIREEGMPLEAAIAAVVDHLMACAQRDLSPERIATIAPLIEGMATEFRETVQTARELIAAIDANEKAASVDA